MYKTLLILKYLRKRRIAWVSLLAVTLCTTMVIVVMSVMSGWLSMFRESARGLTGEIVISRKSLSGFGDYDKVIARLNDLSVGGRKVVKAAVPTIETFGLINIGGKIQAGVQVIGLPIDQIGQVNKFPQSLYRQHNARTDAKLTEDEKRFAYIPPEGTPPSFQPPLPPDMYRSLLRPRRTPDGRTVQGPDPATLPGIIIGAGVIGIRPDLEGNIDYNIDYVIKHWARLTVMGVSEDTNLNLDNRTERMYWIADASRTGMYEQDRNTVYVPFDILQEDLQMGPQEYTDARTGQKVIEPARTHTIQVSLNSGFHYRDAVPLIQKAVDEALGQSPDDFDPVAASSWETLRADFMQAIEREIVLTTLLFAIISVVAVFLIFCIFYMIVAEKTKDIGIIKSVGASGGGVASIFLGYGLAIGVIGGGLGLLISWLIVKNINEIHSWMARTLGVEVYTAKTYMFDKIPDELDPYKVSVIVLVAILSSVAGSIIPALRAARMNPVEALRWE